MTDKVLAPLAEALRFSTEDLRQNRQGKLSIRQKGRLWARCLGTLAGGLALALAPILLTWLLLGWSNAQLTQANLADSRAWLGYAVGLALGAFFFVANFRAVFLLPDLLAAQTVPLEAQAQVWGRYLVIKQRRFVLEPPSLELIRHGVRYRVYFLPLSNTLLSLEFAD
ncbi:MAG: hypothetical protein HC915_11430 [Anaerolineae bacterium]|nr:hypothetical protein [Anaerolineae bacterium]